MVFSSEQLKIILHYNRLRLIESEPFQLQLSIKHNLFLRLFINNSLVNGRASLPIFVAIPMHLYSIVFSICRPPYSTFVASFGYLYYFCFPHSFFLCPENLISKWSCKYSTYFTQKKSKYSTYKKVLEYCKHQTMELVIENRIHEL